MLEVSKLTRKENREYLSVKSFNNLGSQHNNTAEILQPSSAIHDAN